MPGRNIGDDEMRTRQKERNNMAIQGKSKVNEEQKFNEAKREREKGEAGRRKDSDQSSFTLA